MKKALFSAPEVASSGITKALSPTDAANKTVSPPASANSVSPDTITETPPLSG